MPVGVVVWCWEFPFAVWEEPELVALLEFPFIDEEAEAPEAAADVEPLPLILAEDADGPDVPTALPLPLAPCVEQELDDAPLVVPLEAILLFWLAFASAAGERPVSLPFCPPGLVTPLVRVRVVSLFGSAAVVGVGPAELQAAGAAAAPPPLCIC